MDNSREKLAFYAALLYSRATQKRDHTEKNHKTALTELLQAVNDEKLIEEITNALSTKLGKPANKDTVGDAIKLWLNRAQDAATVKNFFLADLIRTAESIADALSKKEPWRVIKAPDASEFVTSDNPLITFVPLGNGKLHPGYGFNKPEAVAAFPVAPNACLVAGNWRVHQTVDAGTLAELNEAIISLSDRYVYSKTRFSHIHDAVQQYAGTSRYGVNAFVPIGIKLPTARQVLRTHFGLPPE